MLNFMALYFAPRLLLPNGALEVLRGMDVQKEEWDTEMLRVVAMGKISSSSFDTLPTIDVSTKYNSPKV